MSELKTIKLYGTLGAKFGRTHRMAVSSVAEAITALSSQFAGFEQHMAASKDNGITYAVFLGKKNINQKDLKNPLGSSEIRIAPIIIGSKKAGVFQTILGVVLIVVGAMIGVGSAGLLGVVAVSLVSMGISMVVGGVIQMLTPSPKAPDGRDRPEDNASYTFNGPVNTQAQGNPVPVLYGRLKSGSAVISAGIIANQEQIAGRTDGNEAVWGGGGFNDRVAFIAMNQV